MLTIDCEGVPYDIGYEHGVKATVQIQRSIEFYAGLFKKRAKLDWSGVRETAKKFALHIHENLPSLEDEMRGVAEGAGVTYEDILALNVRTEIAFGLFSDGCTALAWKTDDKSFLGQNWDWMTAQKQNLIVLNIEQMGKPSISMITEAGIIGKIGLNSAGVGVCLNAILVKGMDHTRTPVHLCLRLILESSTRQTAISAVERYGCASAAHMLIADPTGSVGLEVTAKTVVKLPMDVKSRVFHSNHLLVEHPGMVDTLWIGDTVNRNIRIRQLADKLGAYPDEDDIKSLFLDEDNYPFSINRAKEGTNESATLFNIVMDLTSRTASVRLGRPTEVEENVVLRPTSC